MDTLFFYKYNRQNLANLNSQAKAYQKNTAENMLGEVAAINSISIIPALLELVCQTTGMGFAAIARVTEDKWIACSVLDKISFGLKAGDELQLQTTICNEIRQHKEPVVIDNVETDERYATHQTPILYGFKSYISVPIIRKDGSFFGTLCAIDPAPNQIDTPLIVGMFQMYAELIAFHLQAVEKFTESEASLLEERKLAELKDQFIAILGHDLRNPVSAISTSVEMLLRMPLDGMAYRLSTIIRNSSIRIKGLIDNILDFTKGQLGDGLSITRKSNEPIKVILDDVISELLTVYPERIVEAQYNLQQPVNCDGDRIAQLFSNLLGNALTYGKEGFPILVKALSASDKFTLTITNRGEKIQKERLAHLFEPFYRIEKEKAPQGLGLGLYISSQIAHAHNGSLVVESSDEQTTFTLTIPIDY